MSEVHRVRLRTAARIARRAADLHRDRANRWPRATDQAEAALERGADADQRATNYEAALAVAGGA